MIRMVGAYPLVVPLKGPRFSILDAEKELREAFSAASMPKLDQIPTGEALHRVSSSQVKPTDFWWNVW